jgi:tRNA/rRNA methyltransferase
MNDLPQNDVPSQSDEASDGPPPVIILVEPQLAENIGATARAMLNCGLQELRLIAPRDGWPNDAASAMASGADKVLHAATLYPDVETAVADLQRVYATTARHRDMIKHEVTPARAAQEMRRAAGQGTRCGVLFGRERIGLTNDEVVLADAVLHVPLNPHFSSLNLAQAVLLVAYEWFQAGDQTAERVLVQAGHETASREELFNLFNHLESALEDGGFFNVAAKKPHTIRTLRNILLRADLAERDVRMLHGVITCLLGKSRSKLT